MTQGLSKNIPLDPDVTLAANSVYIAPSQSAVKSFVDDRLSASEAADLTDGGETTLHTHPTENIQDIVGGMVSGNVETGITVTYDDPNGKLDFVADVLESDIREKLSANRTYYVRTDGSDSNTGLVDSAGGAFLTVQKAITTAQSLDFSIYDVTIQIKDGTYTGANTIIGWLGTGSLTIQGNSGTPANVVISTTSNNCFSITGTLPATLIIKDMKLQTTTSGNCISNIGAGLVAISNLNFGACAGFHISIDGTAARVEVFGNYSITGGASVHWLVNAGGYFTCNSKTITLTGVPAFSISFAYSTRCSNIAAASDTFSGPATGSRYIVDSNAVIFTNGGGANYFPGNAAGSASSGGQYL